MGRIFCAVLVFGFAWESAVRAAGAAEIRAAKVAVPAEIRKGESFRIPLDRYWRGNVMVGTDGLRDNRKQFPEQLTLVEYSVDTSAAGLYELRVQYEAARPSPVHVSLDGDLVKTLDCGSGERPQVWTTLGTRQLNGGNHRLRFTSATVDSPFPVIRAVELCSAGACDVPPKPEPKVVGYRAALPKDWYKGISRKIHGDFHTAGFIEGVGKDFDGDEYGDTLARAGVNGICIFAKGHHGYAYYNTKIGTRHPGLAFDLMGEQIKACHERGIQVWVYFSIGVDELYSSTQEENGKPNPRIDKMPVNVNSHYVKDNLWPMIVESVRDYDIDGVFFDFPGDETFVQQTIRIIKGIKPGVVVAYNHQWEKTRDELRNLDVLEIESWRHKQTLYHWQYVARYARGAVPMTAMTIRFWKGWGDFGGLTDEAMLRYEAATGLANGCLLTIGDHLHPHGRLDRAIYERIGRIFNEAKKIEPYVLDSESVPYVALLRQDERACAALVDAGVHFDVIDTTQSLSPYAFVVIPDGSKIDAEYVGRLEAYVRAGGRALVAGRPTKELADLLGVRIEGEAEPSYVRHDGRALRPMPATDFFTYEKVMVASAAGDTRTVLPLVWPMNHGTIHHSRRQSPPMEKESGHAAVSLRTLDKGNLWYSAVPLFDVYAAWGYTPMRQILEGAILSTIRPEDRLIQVEAPVALEASLTRQGERLIVHLVHCPQGRRTASSFAKDDFINHEPMIDGVPTVSGAKLHLAARLLQNRQLRVLATGKPLTPSASASGAVTFVVPDFGIHAAIVAE